MAIICTIIGAASLAHWFMRAVEHMERNSRTY